MGSHADNARPLGRDVAAALVLKVALLAALYLLFFRADERPVIDGAAAARHLLSVEVPR